MRAPALLLLLAAAPATGGNQDCVPMSDSVSSAQQQAFNTAEANFAAAVKAQGLTLLKPATFNVSVAEYQASPQFQAGVNVVGPNSRHGAIVDVARPGGGLRRVFVWLGEYQLPLGRDADGRVFILDRKPASKVVSEVTVCGCDNRAYQRLLQISPCPGCGGPQPERPPYQAFELPPQFQGDRAIAFEAPAVQVNYQYGQCTGPLPPSRPGRP